jgi:hypothetical protein
MRRHPILRLIERLRKTRLGRSSGNCEIEANGSVRRPSPREDPWGVNAATKTTEPIAFGDHSRGSAATEAEDGRGPIASTERTRTALNSAAIGRLPEIIPPYLDTAALNRLTNWLAAAPDPQEARRLLAVDRAITELVGRKHWIDP